MNAEDVGDFAWLAKVLLLIGVWEMTMGPVYILRGDTAGKARTALWFGGVLGWIGAIHLLIRGGLGG